MVPPRKRQKVSSKKGGPDTNSNSADTTPQSTQQSTEDAPELPFKPITDQEKDEWSGFCEIESDPSFFNAILHGWGVQGAQVREVISLDKELLSWLPRPIYGLIFLFRYHDITTNSQEASCPPHVWFANQTHDFACATVSLLNIVLNTPNLELGENLAQFKEFTKDFTPAVRGDQIGHWSFVRSVHNSFARRMDMLNIDLGLKNQYDDRHMKSKTSEKKRTPKKKKRKGKGKGVISDDDFEEDEESTAAFHFVAFVPIDGEVWRLDGLNRQPEKLPGRFQPENAHGSESPVENSAKHEINENYTSSGGDQEHSSKPGHGEWIDLALPHLEDMMASFASQGDMEFSLLALVQDPLLSYKQKLAQGIESLRLLELKMDETYTNPRWRMLVREHEDGHFKAGSECFVPVHGSVVRINETSTETQLPLDPLDLPNASPSEDTQRLCQSSATFDVLLAHWHELARRITDDARQIRECHEQAAQDLEKAQQRRSDYSPVIWTWLKMLSDKDGVLRRIIEIMEAGD